jgi:hypothetical protein
LGQVALEVRPEASPDPLEPAFVGKAVPQGSCAPLTPQKPLSCVGERGAETLLAVGNIAQQQTSVYISLHSAQLLLIASASLQAI